MVETWLSQVENALKSQGISVCRAWGNTCLAPMKTSVVTLDVGKVDYTPHRVTIVATIYTPLQLTGRVCLRLAEEVNKSVSALCRECRQGAISVDHRVDCYSISLEMLCEDSQEPEPQFSVKMEHRAVGFMKMGHVVSVTALREEDLDHNITYPNAKWHVTVEEVFPRGTREGPFADVDFTLTISRSYCDEAYLECKWVSIRRIDEGNQLRQIRIAEAVSRKITMK